MDKKKWIQGMHMKKGALHEEMHVPEEHKIPKKKLAKAAKSGGKLGKRARLAETLSHMHHKGKHHKKHKSKHHGMGHADEVLAKEHNHHKHKHHEMD